MPLPAAASPTLLSAFDFVGGECFAGPTTGPSSTGLARSDEATGAFDDRLQDELRGADSLALLGLTPASPAVPATAAPLTEPEQLSAIDLGTPAAAGDAATNLRQLVLGQLRPPISSESAFGFARTVHAETGALVSPAELQKPAIDDTQSATAATTRGIGSGSESPVVGENETSGLITDAETSVDHNTSFTTREQTTNLRSASVTSTTPEEADEPVILSLDGHRQLMANQTQEGQPVPRRESKMLDEADRSQLLPFTPIIAHGGIASAPDVTEAAESAARSQSTVGQIVVPSEQGLRSPVDPSTPALPADDESQQDIAEAADVDNDVLFSNGFETGLPVSTNAPSQTPVAAAIVSGTIATSPTPTAVRAESATRPSDSPTGEVGRRDSGLRTPLVQSGDDSSFAAPDADATVQTVSAVRSSRPRPDSVVAARRTNDPDVGEDLSSDVQASAVSNSGDGAAQPEPAAAEPSVVQQVSQAVETWRDALQEQGSARFATWLTPPDLGHVWVELTRSSAGITARLKASDDSVQSLLESQEPELRQALNDSGISVAELNLSGRPAGDSGSDRQHPQPDRHDDNETTAIPTAGPVRRGNTANRSSAIDVRA